MKIIGIDGLTDEQIRDELARGARFVVYQYCVSIVVLTFKRPSSIHFVRSGQSAARAGMRFTALSLVLGWWGIPWGIVYTVQSAWVNCRGGHDVTWAVLSAAAAAPAAGALQPANEPLSRKAAA